MTISKIFLNKPYGLKVNDVWFFFNTRNEYVKYLNKWIEESSGIVMFKAVVALDNLNRGIHITNMDLI